MTNIIRATILLFLTLATTNHVLFSMQRNAKSVRHPVATTLGNINLRPETRKILLKYLDFFNSVSPLFPELSILTHEFTDIGEAVREWLAELSTQEFTQLLVKNKIFQNTKPFLHGSTNIGFQNLTTTLLHNAISELQGTHFDTLYLGYNSLGTLEAEDLRDTFSKLQETNFNTLYLTRNQLATLGAEGLHHALSGLQGTPVFDLDLSMNSLGTLGAKGLYHVLSARKGTKVNRLGLLMNDLATLGAYGLRHALSALEGTEVERLHLAGNQFDIFGAEDLLHILSAFKKTMVASIALGYDRSGTALHEVFPIIKQSFPNITFKM